MQLDDFKEMEKDDLEEMLFRLYGYSESVAKSTSRSQDKREMAETFREYMQQIRREQRNRTK